MSDYKEDAESAIWKASESSKMKIRSAIGSPIANPVAASTSQAMTAPTREEVDAKLETIEARMDGRVSLIIGKIDTMIATMDGRDLVTAQRFEHIESSVRGFKTTLIVTALASVIAIVGGIATFNATVLSNMVASFESGKNTATAITQATEQLKQTQKSIEDRFPAAAPVKK